MNDQSRPRRKTGITIVTLGVVALGLFVAFPRCIHRLDKRVALADALNNARSMKIALNEFASDFDGQYPNKDTARQLGLDYPLKFSNDYFRQAIPNKSTDSERIFWVKHSPFCRKSKPDDRIKKNGKFIPSLILEPGDVHWAYFTEQTDTSVGTTPLIVDPFAIGKDSFDPKLWDGKAIVVRIDNSANTLRLNVKTNRLMDSNGKDYFSPEADYWRGREGNPMDFLIQPAPKP